MVGQYFFYKFLGIMFDVKPSQKYHANAVVKNWKLNPSISMKKLYTLYHYHQQHFDFLNDLLGNSRIKMDSTRPSKGQMGWWVRRHESRYHQLATEDNFG